MLFVTLLNINGCVHEYLLPGMYVSEAAISQAVRTSDSVWHTPDRNVFESTCMSHLFGIY